MKNIRYKQFVRRLPVDTKTVIDYAFSIYKDIKSKKIYINKKNKQLKEIDKAYLSLFIALLTINTEIKTYFLDNDVDRDTVLEFLETYNDKIIFPLETKIIFEDEKEQIYLDKFIFLEKLTEKYSRISPRNITEFLFSNNDLSKILDTFFKENYRGITNAKEHKSVKGLDIKDEQSIEVKKDYEELLEKKEEKIPSLENVKKEITYKESSLLNEYGINYKNKKNLHTAISREQELRNILIALKTPSKRSVLLVGDPGVGKRTIIESLAKEFKEGKNIPEEFINKEIIEIDISSIIAGTTFRGQLEERIKEILDEAKKNQNIILFINDIHKGINSGEEDNKIDFVTMLNNYLARGEISIIATTTKDAYANILLQNNICNKLWKISVEEPSIEVVEKILYSCIFEISEITNIEFPKDEKRNFMIKIIAQTTSKEKRGFFSSANNPDLAKGILERTFAIASINNHKEVMEEDLIEAIETDESLSKEAREKQANIIRQTLPKIKNNNNNVIKLKLIK